MIKKLFRNRIQQESEDTIEQLKRTYINMNDNKYRNSNTPEGLFLITLQPNCYVDELKLEADFRFILCLYYRWMYGTGWNKKHHLQFEWSGLIEKQSQNHNHIHFKIYEDNIEKLAIFLGYIKAVFKQLYPKASFDFQCVYDEEGCDNYIAPLYSTKDMFIRKRRKSTFYLDSNMYQ